MSERIWRVRYRWLDGHPPTDYGPYTVEELREFLNGEFLNGERPVFEITVVRGDCGGELDRSREQREETKP